MHLVRNQARLFRIALALLSGILCLALPGSTEAATSIGSLASSTADIWSSKMLLASYSSRPISVDLPSSTEPAVENRSNSITKCFLRAARSGFAGRAEHDQLP